MLENKVIFLIGGFGLLGSEFSKGILRNGGQLIVGDVSSKKNKKQLENLISQFPSRRIEFLEIDISDENSIQKNFKNLSENSRRIDALVNTAYPRNENYGNDFLSVSQRDFNENISLHLGGYFSVSKHAIKFFIDQGKGNIINIASIYGLMAPNFDIYEKTDMTMPVEYSAIKSGIIHLTKYMAKYLKGHKIRVNCISPGGVNNNHSIHFKKNYSKYTLNKGMLDAQDISGALIFLLSDASEFINGQNIVVDDGFSL
ncbi:oxidoreductase [Flavobacteriaceae bacterium]|nr:oxidoreductase [Flavobacteriaceae bacterium]